MLRLPPPTHRGDDAHAQAHRHEVEEHISFSLLEGEALVIPAHDVADGGERVGLAEGRVGGGDGRLAHGARLDHVAKVDQPDGNAA